MANTDVDVLKEIAKLQKTTVQQRVFAIAYATTGSMSVAVSKIKPVITIAEGYKWLSNAGVQTMIRAIRAEQKYESIVSQQMLEALWLEALPKLMGEEQVSLGVDRDGLQREGFEFNASGLMALLKEMRTYMQGDENSVNINITPTEIRRTIVQRSDDV